MQSFYHPSLRWGGEENTKKKAKLMGHDKGSLTKEQRKRTITTTILIRTREYAEQLSLTSQWPVCSQAMINLPPASSTTRK